MIDKLQKLGSLLFVLVLAALFAQGIIDEASLHISSNYTIAHLTKIYRGAKWECLVNYWYVVQGEKYERTATWDGKTMPGQRCVVRYANFSPRGNKLLPEVIIPDSIPNDKGPEWQAFLLNENL